MNLVIYQNGTTPSLEWDKSLSVGIAELDDQHKEMIDLLNELHRSLLKSDQVQARKILDALIQCTQIHFSVEESLMQILNYPEYDEHKYRHSILLVEMRKLQSRVKNWQQADYERLILLKTSFSRHFMEEDKDYSAFFHNHGIEKKKSSSRSLLGLFG
ncbi:bacteriohemerythrin [Endozoicomonadaceae bacterium StTr2]